MHIEALWHKPVTVFQGIVQETVKLFPKNVNMVDTLILWE